MTMTHAKPAVFLDTNVILRYNIIETPEYPQVRSAVDRLLNNGQQLWISRQIIREFCTVLTRPQTFLKPLTRAEVAARAKTLLSSFWVADETRPVTEKLLDLLETIPMGGKQVHDANIVATMQAYNLTHLFTLNPVDFVRFANLITVVTLEELLKPPLPG